MEEKICWTCKYYIRPKPILFGLGATDGECKKLDIYSEWNNTCNDYTKNKWKIFWDRVTRQV